MFKNPIYFLAGLATIRGAIAFFRDLPEGLAALFIIVALVWVFTHEDEKENA